MERRARWAKSDEMGKESHLLGARRVGVGRVVFGDYPNAFGRISEAFCDVSGDVRVTAEIRT